MKKDNNKLLFEAVATFVGTVIGAGILGIPYIVASSGFFTGIFVIIFLGIISAIIYLYLGEITLRTKGFHQLTGYAERYLGNIGKKLMTFSMLVGIYGALIAYIIGEGNTLSAIFNMKDSIIFSFLGIQITSQIFFSLIFFFIVSFIVYLGLDAVAESEFYLLPIMIIIITIISLISIPHINPANFTSFNIYKFLIPYGVILFAFLGATAVPEMQQELYKNKKLLKRSIIIGTLIPLIIYIAFASVVVGVTGTSTTEVATIGLGNMLGQKMLIFGNIFAIFAMATSFLALALALQQMYEYDYKLNKKLAWTLTCIIPLIVALSNTTSFIQIIGLGGVIAGGIDGILIVLILHKAKKHGDRKPEYSLPVNWITSTLLIFLFLIGAGYYFITLL